MQTKPDPHSRAPRILIPLVVVLIVLVIGASSWFLLNKQQAQSGQTGTTHTAVPTQNSGEVSPLLFGTNLGLFNGNDQVLRSEPTRAALQQMHPRIMRMPVRQELTEAVEVQAAQTIKALGAVPLVVLHSVSGANVVAADTSIIKAMNGVFGKSVVYYEFGNEDDWAGVSATTYTKAWNQVIPQMKQVALNGQFVGPVNYQYNGDFLRAFLQQAQPRPDEISWHEYTCSYKWPADQCIANIDNWNKHISDSRAAMQATIGTELPVMITEWNYAPDAAYNDGKNNNSAFMTTWTNKALQTLANNRIFASMQYSCTNTAIPLVDNDNKITFQGAVFEQLYVKMILHGKVPAPTPATPTVSLNGVQNFSFEDGSADGWSGRSSGVSAVQNSTAFAFAGKHALQVTLTNISAGNYPYIAVDLASQTSYPGAGKTVTAYAYLPAGSLPFTAKLFVVGSDYHWYSNDAVQLKPGTWNPLTYTLSATMSGVPKQIGIQFDTSASGPASGKIYVDAVGWQ
ncbi:MAG: hypothetical protein H0V70_08550 [Ktedonobacteraceae bacterium]|nr:hypothetical protein [Ktedonobacteraceae bacterium]